MNSTALYEKLAASLAWIVFLSTSPEASHLAATYYQTTCLDILISTAFLLSFYPFRNSYYPGQSPRPSRIKDETSPLHW